MDLSRSSSRSARLAVAVLVVGFIAGCGNSGSGGGSTSTPASGATTTAGASAGCGVVPSKPLPSDPDGVLASLPGSTKKLYDGFGGSVVKSRWADWKPSHGGKYTVGITFNALINPFNAALYKQTIAMLKQDPSIGKVIAYTASNPTDTAGQVQQFQSLVRQKVDLIIGLMTPASAFRPVIAQAAKAGIPTISLVNQVGTPDSVDIAPNTWQDVAEPVTTIINAVHQKGEVLLVHGITGTAGDVDEFKAFHELLAACPNMKVAGEVTGQYNPPVVTSAVLKFLSTHPAPVAAVFQTATMAPSIIAAFQKAGRQVPPVLDVGAQVGSLAYWHDNRSKGYTSAGTLAGATALVTEGVQVAQRMLAGQGPKLNLIVWYQPVITDKDVDRYYKPGTTLQTPGTVDGPASLNITGKKLDPLFNHPGAQAK